MTGPFRAFPTPRIEDQRLVTGAGRYVANLPRESAVHAVFLRSHEAHGVIHSVQIDEARKMPGVLAILTAGDLDLPDINPQLGPSISREMPRPILARDKVLHTGEAVAIVLAESPAAAADAAAEAWVDIEGLPPVIDPELSKISNSSIHPAASTNVVEDFQLGDADIGWSHEVDITSRVVNQRLAPTPMEPMAVLASPRDYGVRLTVGHQSPHVLKSQLRELLDFDVEVEVPDVGGSFGLKGRLYPEYVVLCAVAHRYGREVRYVQTRSEQILTGSHGRDMIHTVRLAGDRTGRIRRAHFEILSDVGAYIHTGAQIASFTRLVAQGPYDIEDLSISSATVVTNKAIVAPYRGAGRPEAAYAMERAVDDFARAVGKDPVEVRRINMIARTDLPYHTHTGAIYDSGDYVAALDEAARLIDLQSIRDEQVERRNRTGNPLGIGFGAYIERSGGTPDAGEYARLELTSVGNLRVFTGSTSSGQGHETVWSQVAAQVLDLDPSRVEIVAGDTSVVARGSGSTASRSAQIGASAVWVCTGKLKSAALEVAALLLDVSPADVEMSGGAFHASGDPRAAVELVDIAAAAPGLGIPLDFEEWYSPGAQAFPYGVHAAVVEVDVSTGQVDILRYAAVDDCGNMLNPSIVDGQTVGSIAQGVGQAIYESVEYGPDGQLRSGSLVDYLIPSALDIPPIDTAHIVSPAPSNILGAKGAGESGCIGAPPGDCQCCARCLGTAWCSRVGYAPESGTGLERDSIGQDCW